MKASHNPLISEFNIKTGNFNISSQNINLSEHLTQHDFLHLKPAILKQGDPQEARTYYFKAPVKIWNRQFMLSVSFLPHSAPFCSGYGLQPVFEIERQPYDVTKDKEDFNDLKNLLTGIFSRPPRIISEINRAVWNFSWGIASIGSVIQNSSPVAISIGWPIIEKNKSGGS